MSRWLWRWWIHPIEEEWTQPLGSSYRDVQGAVGKVLLATMLSALTVVAIGWRTLNLPLPTYSLFVEGQKPERVNTLLFPAMTSEKVRRWTSRAIKDTFSMNFYNMEERLALAGSYFTPAGWEELQRALKKAELPETIRNNQLHVVLTPTAIPTIVHHFVLNGRVYWNIEVPVLIEYTGAKERETESSVLSLLVGQVSTKDDPEGLAIYKLQQHGQ
jgi:hypothetical protein